MAEQTLVKITRPRLSDVLPRTRLFRRFDEIREQSPLVWITGPAGSGKTTLLASYLDANKLPCLWYHLDEGDSDIATFFYYLGLAANKAMPRQRFSLPLLTMEYLRGIPTFTKRYFENLCSRLKPPFVIVFDNYHHVATDSLFHDMLREALSVIPDGITVMISSRGATPPSLARLCVYKKMQLVDWDDLKFDAIETRELIGAKQNKKLNDDLLRKVERLTTGWAAGLVLLTERLRTGDIAAHELDRVKPEEFFDYFTAELFGKVNRDTQTFLLKTSFLPRIAPQAALELTDNEKAGALLAELNRSNFFTERSSASDPVYQYHPLFREFLQARAHHVFSTIEMRAIMRTAAVLLDEAGQIEDAAELYCQSQDWEHLAGLIKVNARKLTTQGRTRPLEKWLKSLPPEILNQEPWLLYWMGICRMLFDLPEGLSCFDKSLTLFRRHADPAGIFLSWCGAVESISIDSSDNRQLEPWLSLIDELMKEHAFPSPEIEARVTLWTFVPTPWVVATPLLIPRLKKAQALLESDAHVELRLQVGFYVYCYYAWTGDYIAAEKALDISRLILKAHKNAPPLAHIMVNMTEGWFALLKGSHEQCLRIVSEGLARSKDSGVHLWESVLLNYAIHSSLYIGDFSGAGRYLEQMVAGLQGARLLDRFLYHYQLSLRSFIMNDLPQSIIHQESALAFAPQAGLLFFSALSHFAMAHLMRTTGETAKSREHIDQCREIGREMGSSIIEFMSLLTEAAFAFDRNDDNKGLAHLQEALSLGRENGYVSFDVWYPTALTVPLCVKALEAGIETEYVLGLIRACRMAPEEPPLHIESWPWAVKIYTLGRFTLLMDGKPMIFSGKVRKKPLDMLKALITFGGQNVREDQVMEALWPDADGDTARISFKTTLHRLRQLLGREDIVQVQDGRIGLDRRYCWVDVWAFEKMVHEIENRRKNGGDERNANEQHPTAPPLLRLAEQAVNLYHGHFLDKDDDKLWTFSFKERLRNKYICAVTTLGDQWLEQSEASNTSRSSGCDSQSAIQRAIECYQRGVEIDDGIEEFYQNLMICHHKLGKKAEAVKVYNRCRNVLATSLGVEPSEETETIYGRIRNK